MLNTFIVNYGDRPDYVKDPRIPDNGNRQKAADKGGRRWRLQLEAVATER